jgi:hypothetical protein
MWISALLSACLAFAAAGAQPKPDFTGTWKQDSSRSTPGADPTFRYSNVVVHREPRLVVTTITGSRTKPDSASTQTFFTDRKPHPIVLRNGIQVDMSLRWEGDKLIFQTQAGALSAEETWSLSEDGKTLTKIRTGAGLTGETHEKYVLEKQ